MNTPRYHSRTSHTFTPLSRRALLRGASILTGTAAATLATSSAYARNHSTPSPTKAPSASLLSQRPSITHGVASGDIRSDGALIWSRTDRPARMIVEVSQDPLFPSSRTRRFQSTDYAQPQTDGTARLRILGREPGTTQYYRVSFQDADTGALSAPVTGSFRTAPTKNQNIRIHWSGDVAGQGYGINPEMGGMTGWSAMVARHPDLFIHSGDTCYADGPIEESVVLDDGRIWKNITSDAKHAVAQSLEDFRGNYAYNLLDEHYKIFNSQVAQAVQWDDHETVNNWYMDEVLDPKDHKGYTERNVRTLQERAYQAFHEWQPLDRTMAVDNRVYRKISMGPLVDIFMLDMRTYKDDNRNVRTDPQKPGTILGDAQRTWLTRELKKSQATWKIIANDLPLGLVVPDGKTGAQEGVSNGKPGKPGGREHEIAHLLKDIKDIKNILWLTADVHYTAAHHYSPDRAEFQDFSPFWEFVSGPLHAGAFGPNDLDPTFGPRVEYVHAPGKDHQNSSPLDDFQHFGEVDVDGSSRELTIRLFTTRGRELWTKTFKPQE